MRTRLSATSQDLDFFTISQVKDKLGVGSARAYDLVRKNQIPHIVVGGRILVPRNAYELWNQSQTASALAKVGVTLPK